MNSLVSADYGTSSDSGDDENLISAEKTNDKKNFLQSASDSEIDSNDEDNSNSSNDESKSK